MTRHGQKSQTYVLLAEYKEGAEEVKVSVSHDLPVGASQYDFFLSFAVKRIVGDHGNETNKYTAQTQKVKADKN